MTYRKFIKPFFDTCVSLLLLLLLSPVFLIVTILLTAANNGSPFFKQARPGLWGSVFNVIKFKTMNDKRDESGKLLPDAIRLTHIGRIIRSLSIDELPQLINVFKGDMSLVGPRPLLVRYLNRYTPEQARRHEVRPGITGWAQVNGRNAISWEKKFEYDVYYVENLSFGLDVKILWLTILKVFRRDGINNAPGMPMDEFLGS